MGWKEVLRRGWQRKKMVSSLNFALAPFGGSIHKGEFCGKRLSKYGSRPFVSTSCSALDFPAFADLPPPDWTPSYFLSWDLQTPNFKV